MKISLLTSIVGATWSANSGTRADVDAALATRLIEAGFAEAVPVEEPPVDETVETIETATAPEAVMEQATVKTTPAKRKAK